MQTPDDLVQLFRQQGRRITPQRRAIFDILANDNSHPTAEEVYQRVSSAMPDTSRTTVYNTIRELVTLGELVEVEELSAAGARYDTHTAAHHHLFCMGCHALVDIPRDLAAIELGEEERAGYQVTRQQLTFYGYCPACQRDLRRRAPQAQGGSPGES